MFYQYQRLCKKTLILGKPFPCDQEAETAFQPLIWCSESLYSQGNSFLYGCFSSQTPVCLRTAVFLLKIPEIPIESLEESKLVVPRGLKHDFDVLGFEMETLES